MKATLFTLAKNEETRYNKRNWHNEMKKIKTNKQKKKFCALNQFGIRKFYRKTKTKPKKKKRKKTKILIGFL